MTSYPPHKATFAAVATLWFIWLLLVAAASHAAGEPPAVTAELAAESGTIFRETAAGGGGKLVRPQWHLNYMSKRRVPNGPDPIHNRRAGNSGRPPGKA